MPNDNNCKASRWKRLITLQMRAIKRTLRSQAPGRMPKPPSCQHVLYDMPMHVRQSSLDAVVVEAQAFVIQAEQVQDCGV